MLTRTIAARMPAVSLYEAAMLPALEPETPGNLLIRRETLNFRPVIPAGRGQPVDNSVHRGTMAGKALLQYVRSAPARRQRRCRM